MKTIDDSTRITARRIVEAYISSYDALGFHAEVSGIMNVNEADVLYALLDAFEQYGAVRDALKDGQL